MNSQEGQQQNDLVPRVEGFNDVGIIKGLIRILPLKWPSTRTEVIPEQRLMESYLIPSPEEVTRTHMCMIHIISITMQVTCHVISTRFPPLTPHRESQHTFLQQEQTLSCYYKIN